MTILASTSISFLSVILFIISLGVLVIIHELGHLSMANERICISTRTSVVFSR